MEEEGEIISLFTRELSPVIQCRETTNARVGSREPDSSDSASLGHTKHTVYAQSRVSSYGSEVINIPAWFRKPTNYPNLQNKQQKGQGEEHCVFVFLMALLQTTPLWNGVWREAAGPTSARVRKWVWFVRLEKLWQLQCKSTGEPHRSEWRSFFPTSTSLMPT